MKRQATLKNFSPFALTMSISHGLGGNGTKAISAFNLSSVLDSISDDGQKAKVVRMSIQGRQWVQLFATNKNPFALTWYILQTNGTVSSYAGSQDYTENEILAKITDDVFGYQRITNTQASKMTVLNDVGNGIPRLDFNFVLPQNILSLLNKESETERLQDSYLVCIYQGKDGETVQFDCFAEIDYTLVRKTISIR